MKMIATVVLVLLLMGASIYVPVGTCYNLGFRGTTTKDTVCRFEKYYFVHKRPRGDRGSNTQIRVYKPRLIMTWAIIFAAYIVVMFALKVRKERSNN